VCVHIQLMISMQIEDSF